MGNWLWKKSADLWTGICLTVFSGAVIVEALDLELGTPASPGSGFMIFGVAVLLGVLALAQVLKALVSRGREEETAGEEIHRWRVAVVIGANVLYIALLELVGYLLCTFLLLTFLLQVYEKGKWIWALGAAAATSLATYGFFSKLLQLNLPKGLIPFL